MAAEIKSYRDLLVWQKAMDLVSAVYPLTSSFPKEELYGLISQIRRCVVSIPSNIAEGYGRNSLQDYIRFLQIAMGSLNEFQTQIEIALRLGYLDSSAIVAVSGLAHECEKMLNSLIAKLRNK